MKCDEAEGTEAWGAGGPVIGKQGKVQCAEHEQGGTVGLAYAGPFGLHDDTVSKSAYPGRFQ